METYDHGTPYPSDSETTSGAVSPVNTNQRRAVGTAAAGTVALGAIAYGLSRLEDSEQSDGDGSGNGLAGQGDDSGLTNNANGNGSGAASASALTALETDPNAGKAVPVDNRSLDDMTFEEAFAAARHAMGPGHHFTWHGGLYNTFHTEELDAMSTAERLAFVETLGLEKDEIKPAKQHQVAATTHHHGSHHNRHHHTPDLADNPSHEAPEVHPITVVPVAMGHTEVTPIVTDPHDAPSADLLTADHIGSDHTQGSAIGPVIDSVDDHHDQNTDDAHHSLDHDASDDDQEVHFAY